MTGTMDGALESSKLYVKMWKEFLQDVDGKVDEKEGVMIRWSGTNLTFFNVLTFIDGNVNQIELKKRLEFGLEYMQQNKEPGMFPLFKELLTDEARLRLQKTYERVGFHLESKEFGMAGEISTLQEPHHPDLRFERIKTEEDMKTYNTLNALAHNVDPSDFIKMIKLSKLWNEIGFGFIGYLRKDDKPVCCASAFPVEKSLFLIGVATDPNYWRHGYGETITRKALFEAGKGYNLTRVVFQSTEIGKSVYERIGMKVTCNVHTLVLPQK